MHTHVLHGISRHSRRQCPHANLGDLECSSGISMPSLDMVKVQKMPVNLQIMIFVNNVHSDSINIQLSYNMLWYVLYWCISIQFPKILLVDYTLIYNESHHKQRVPNRYHYQNLRDTATQPSHQSQMLSALLRWQLSQNPTTTRASQWNRTLLWWKITNTILIRS